MAVRCIRIALPLLLCLGDSAEARRGERGVALPAGDAAVPSLGPAELEWCITQEPRIDQEQQAVDTAAAALRVRAAQIQEARGELLLVEGDALAASQARSHSMRVFMAEQTRRALRDREAILEQDTARSQEQATALAGIIAEYDSRCAGRSYLESDLRALQSRVGR